MKVAYVVGVFPPEASHLVALSESVELVVYGTRSKLPWHHWDPSPPEGIAFREFRPLVPTKRGQILWVYPGMRSSLDEDLPDVLHVVSEPWGTLAAQATTWALRHPEVTLVFHGCDRIWWHGSVVEQKARRALAKRALKRSDAYVAESSTALGLAKQVGLRSDRPTAAIHTNSRDPGIFKPPIDDQDRRHARRRLGLPEEGVGIGFMARLAPTKGPHLFLRALAQLLPELGDQVWAALAGSGRLESEIKSEAQKLGVSFLGSLSYPSEAADFYRGLDIFVVPSYTTEESDEQSPRSVIESMMASCVVVGSRCGMIPEMLGQAGIVVEERDVQSLVDGIRGAMARSRDWNLRVSARARAISMYSGEAIARDLLELWARARRGVSESRSTEG
jgi:glycosyltransferase involved in cell wall biosynthesis